MPDGRRSAEAPPPNTLAMDDDESAPQPTVGSYAFAVLPTLALTLGIPFANRVEPRIFGLPFLLAYIVMWIVVTPLFMFAALRAMRIRG